MKSSSSFLALLLVAACSSSASAPSEAQRSSARAAPRDALHPVVVELFQSQGCSSCPPANALLNAVADDPTILPLSFAVTYWDYLGWKDGFAKPQFTSRQWDYAKAGGRQQVYTPQMIFNGSGMMTGGDRAHFRQLVSQSGGTGGPAIEVRNGQLVVGEGAAPKGARVLLVRYDPRVRNVAIKAGENGGRTLPHRNIVTDLRDLGAWTGKEVRFPLGALPNPAIRTAVLIQQGLGGPIIAARRSLF